MVYHWDLRRSPQGRNFTNTKPSCSLKAQIYFEASLYTHTHTNSHTHPHRPMRAP